MKLFAKILRKLCYPLVCFAPTYYLGMVFIRLSRKCRKANYKKSGQNELSRITVFGNVKMDVLASNYMGGSLYWGGMHHVNEMIYLKRTLKSNHTFIDVGANQGEFSLFAASLLTKGKVISFEPVLKQLTMLKNNVELNEFKNIEINEFGLSNENGELPIYTSQDVDSHSGIHEGLSSLYKSDNVDSLEQVVPLKIFDEVYFENLKAFDFLKIDIEGAELYALKGMVKSLRKFKPSILLEINDQTFTAAGYSSGDIITFLGELGYSAYSIRRGNLVPVELQAIKEWGNYIFEVDNK